MNFFILLIKGRKYYNQNTFKKITKKRWLIKEIEWKWLSKNIVI